MNIAWLCACAVVAWMPARGPAQNRASEICLVARLWRACAIVLSMPARLRTANGQALVRQWHQRLTRNIQRPPTTITKSLHLPTNVGKHTLVMHIFSCMLINAIIIMYAAAA